MYQVTVRNDRGELEEKEITDVSRDDLKNKSVVRLNYNKVLHIEGTQVTKPAATAKKTFEDMYDDFAALGINLFNNSALRG